jgi:uncharacterized protein YndB with AHSA1/START domain
MASAQAKAAASGSRTLTMERRFTASRERVWRAWTSPSEIRKWWSGGPNKGVNTVEECVYEPRVGGRLRLAIRGNESGNLFVVNGTIVEVDPGRRIVHTWTWEKGPMPGYETRVSVEFLDDGAGTRVTLLHENLPDERMVNDHRSGWTRQFDGIAAYL